MLAHKDGEAVWAAHGWKTVVAEGEWQKELKDKSEYKSQLLVINTLKENLLGMEKVYKDPKHKNLEKQRQDIDKAKKDLQDVFAHISRDNLTAARRMLSRFHATFRTLAAEHQKLAVVNFL